MPPRLLDLPTPWTALGGVFIVFAVTAACSSHRASTPPPAASHASTRAIAGMYWGRFADVPEGMRAQVWLDSDGTRVRGAYTAMPWSGELEGRASPDGVELTFFERGVTRMLGSRTRTVTLQWSPSGDALSGRNSAGESVELARAGFAPASLRPGLWLSHWTGLPFGIAVETRLSQHPDGHWRAVYQYQGSGGVREGSFDGVVGGSGVMDIRWQEVAENGSVARGQGRLTPSAFGFRGTFGIEGGTEELGEWVLEPFDR